jgi:hypothetical protein
MIERHVQLSEAVINRRVTQYEDLWDMTRNALQQRPATSLGYEFREALKYFAVTVAGGLPRERILWALHAMNGIGVANFAFATHPGEPITVQLPDTSFDVIGQAKTDYTDTGTWLKAFCAAVIARDPAGLTTLVRVPEEVYMQANLKPDECGLATVRFLKGLYNPAVDIGKLLIRAVEATHPDLIPDPDRFAYVDHIRYPMLWLYRYILSPEEAGFDEQVEQAVQSHKTFWENRPYDPQGWVALPLLATCTIAWGHLGWAIPVETAYLPAWLTRVGEAG